ncbi:MAG: replication-associated recombination protein A [Myxococcales bacterium]|nr:replication-associated recombination protein A [Myxococcales bacterium]
MARARSTGGTSDASLFDAAHRSDPALRQSIPLAERMRPRSLADLAGQAHLFGKDSPLSRAVEADRVRSMILWGPPGSGKTTLARIIADRTKARFVAMNAVLAGVADVREATGAAREARKFEGRRTILFIDEIHRFNKSQQDALLPQVEDGTFTLIGATTENPSFSVNAPLLSRCKVYRLRTLDEGDLVELLRRAIAAPDGLANAIEVDDEALRAIARLAQGDARRALTSIELAFDEAQARGEGRLGIDAIAAQTEHKTLLYDKAGEEHYNVISAFIKSMRGSDPDASIYWLMRMIESGDDPLFLLRRMLIFASEDIGNADPRALEIAVAADAAFRRMGMPEGLYPLAQATLYLATAPKSNSAGVAYKAAQQAVRDGGALEVPMKLRNAVTALMKNEGYGKSYRYAHDEEEGVARGETYLPDALVGTRFYQPSDRGYEKQIAARLAWLRGAVDGDKPADEKQGAPKKDEG